MYIYSFFKPQVNQNLIYSFFKPQVNQNLWVNHCLWFKKSTCATCFNFYWAWVCVFICIYIKLFTGEWERQGRERKLKKTKKKKQSENDKYKQTIETMCFGYCFLEIKCVIFISIIVRSSPCVKEFKTLLQMVQVLIGATRKIFLSFFTQRRYQTKRITHILITNTFLKLKVGSFLKV